MRRATTVILIISLMLTAAMTAACGNEEGENPLQRCVVTRRVEESKKRSLPDLRSFTAETLDGEAFTEKDLAGHDLTMMNIWATYCGPCLEEMPELAALAASMPDRIQIVTWCMDGADDPETAEAILKDAGFSGRTILTGDGDLVRLGQSAAYVPTTVIVDGGGHMVGEPLIGAPDDPEKAYSEYIDQALKALDKEPL